MLFQLICICIITLYVYSEGIYGRVMFWFVHSLDVLLLTYFS